MLKDLKKLIREYRFSGDKFQCPICNYRAKKFLSAGIQSPIFNKMNIVGGGYRMNVLCPSCIGNDRERLIFIFLEKYLENDRDLKLLHIAPEQRISKILINKKNVEYIAGDKFTPNYVYPDYTIDLDILNSGFNDNSFDWIVCNHVLEHIPEHISALKEIYRILKIGGKAILQVPIAYNLDETLEIPEINSDEKREEYYGQFDHVRLYGKDYPKILASVGFEVKLYDPIEEFSIEIVKKFSINPNEILHVCIK